MADTDLIILFALWYIGNIGYNEWNKQTAEASDKDSTRFAMTISTAQLAVGTVYALLLWGTRTRKTPAITAGDIIKTIPAGVCSAGAHAASVFSLAAGGVAFGQIVKSAEPVFAALVGTIFYGKKLSLAKWLCLIPIIGGVVLASLKLKDPAAGIFAAGNMELDFSVGGLVGALIANLFAAFKGNESHKLMETPGLKDRMGDAKNQFAVMTIVSLVVSIPLMIFKEKEVLGAFTTKLFAAGTVPDVFVAKAGVPAGTPFFNPMTWNLILSGMAFYMYNEWATMSLKKVSAATQSVANTAKRVFVIGWGVYYHGKEFGVLKQAGCAICILGVYVNSMIDTWLAPKSKKA